jgi:hypothetical protein
VNVDMDHQHEDRYVRLLMERNGFAAGDEELEVYRAMVGPVAVGVDRLYAMDGIRYAEPAPAFRVDRPSTGS